MIDVIWDFSFYMLKFDYRLRFQKQLITTKDCDIYKQTKSNSKWILIILIDFLKKKKKSKQK